MRWKVAVTTAPRKDNILDQCLESLLLAGWSRDCITVFAEPGSPPTPDFQTVNHPHRLGVWHNWRTAAAHCLEGNPDVIMTVQDDSLFHPEAKEFTERILWPDSKTGYLSLYTPKHYQEWKSGTPREFGVYEVKTNSVWGAMALVFHPVVLEALLSHPRAIGWTGCKPRRRGSETRAQFNAKCESVKANRIKEPWRIQNSDTIIGILLRRYFKRKLMYASPSMVDHACKFSSISHGDNTGRRNAKYIADHSLPLDFQIPANPGKPLCIAQFAAQ